MVTIKVIAKATVRVVKLRDLKPGDDYILWANWRCKVIAIDRHERKILVESPLPDMEPEWIPFFINYYVIDDFEETEEEI